MLERITPLILTRDEAPNVARTLGQLRWAREVVVVDSVSDDDTVAIARSFDNVRVVQRPFDSLAAQWRFGVEQVRTPWVLTLDADYFVPDAAVREMAALEPPAELAGYVARFRYAIDGRPLRAALYPPRPVLLRMGAFEIYQDGHTQRTRVNGPTEWLREPLVHDDRKPWSRFVERQGRYARDEAAKLRAADPRSLNSAARLRKLRVVAPFAVLLHTLLVKRLIFDGRDGWHYAKERFVAEWLIARELWRQSTWSSRLLRLPLRLVPRQRLLPILSGELRGWHWISGSATHGCWLGTYERDAQRAFADALRPGDVVYDIGANVGFFTLLASKLVGQAGRVVAFEPLPRNLDYLQRHLRANDVRNVRVLPVAVSSNAGIAHFAAAASPAMGGLAEGGELEVRTESLDGLVASGTIPPPAFLKIDVEGAEHDVLHGAAAVLRDHVRAILLSAHGYAQHERCWSLLEEARFTLRLLRDGTEDGNYVVLATRAAPSRGPVLFVNRYFDPDHSATSQMVSDLAFFLAGRGHEVTAVASRQRYDDARARLGGRERVRGVDVVRVATTRFGRAFLPGRAVDYATFYVSAFVALVRRARRGDVVVALTDPPLISVVAALACALRGARLVNWTQDLFPEVATALGVRGVSMARRLRDWSLRRAAMNVALGEQMAERIRARGAPAAVRHNWADAALHPVAREANTLRREWRLGDAFVVAYSGNLGRAHEFATIGAAMRRLGDNARINFLIIGSGAQLEAVRREAFGNALFAPYQPREVLSESLSAGDAHLVSLQPQLEGLIVPSKFYGILAVARPVIFVGAAGGELARLVREHDLGYVVAPGDDAALAHAIEELAADPERAAAMGRRGRALYDERFAPHIALAEWERIIAEAQVA